MMAGSDNAGLRAGIPNIIVPFTADQPIWGNRGHAIGACPKPILVKKLSVEKLTRAIANAEENDIHKRVQVIGQGIRGENGVKCAVELIEEYLLNWKSAQYFKV